jgi:hypothetical protein
MPLNSVLKNGGSSSLGIPLKPALEASIWVIYSRAAYDANAGIAAALMTAI